MIFSFELVRYFMVSLIALSVDLFFFSLALRLAGISWVIAAGAGFFVGALTSWWLSVRFVFRNRIFKKPFTEFSIFLGIGLFSLGITEITIGLSIHEFNITPEFGKLIAAGATFACNFLLRK